MMHGSLIRMGWGLAALTLVLCLAGCSTETEAPSFENPFDPVLGAGLPVPDSVSVLVGDNAVQLSWALPEGESADEYAVFRRRLDLLEEETESLLERVSVRRFTDTRVRNGRVYAYRIAAGMNGRFGKRTEEIEARPGLFSIQLANGQEFTRQRTITVALNAPSAEAVQLSSAPASFTAPWQLAAASVQWVLEPEDGEKTVYARFRLTDGSETVPVSDVILLDTRATILSLDFTGESVRRPGDLLHVRLTAQETHGSATVSAEGVFDAMPLYDDGTHGDQTAGDGVYERDLTIPSAAEAENRPLRGSFTDAAGNSAAEVTAPKLLTVQEAPEAVSLFAPVVAEPPDAPAVSLRWSLSREERFSAYRVFRSESATVDSSDELISSQTSAQALEYEDSDVVEGRTYTYRVYVQSSSGLETGSNAMQAAISNVRVPSAVTLDAPSTTTTSRVALSWSKCGDRDFAAYRVRRNQDGAVSEDDPLIAEITDVDQTEWDDTDLAEDTTYYYRIFTIDAGGLSTRSNEVEGRTKNEAPSAVTLNQPTAMSTTRIALDWSKSTDADFQAYRIYRNESGAVSQSDLLVADISDVHRIYWDDAGLQENTRYHYRIYTSDQGGLIARSNEVEVRTKNEAPPAVTLSAAASIDSTAATLSWSKSQAHDFAFYRLYRDEIPTVTTGSTMVVELDDADFDSFRDTELESETRYYYRVFVVDDGDDVESTGSNTITLVTQ